MKPVYKCDYCNFIGTEDAVREHEARCYDNYDLRGCTTCTYKKTCPSEKPLAWHFECDCGLEIPEGKMLVGCEKYERKEKTVYNDFLDGLFGGLR